MLKKTLTSMSIVTLIFFLLNSQAHAYTEQLYSGANMSWLDYSEDNEDLDLSALVGRVGWHINDNFAGELRLGFGVNEDTLDVVVDGVAGEVEVELDTMYGAYFRAGMWLSESLYPYLVLGYTEIELELSGFGQSDDGSDSDFSYGVGIDFDWDEDLVFTVEYMSYYDDGGTEIDGFSLGAFYKF